LRSIVDEVPSGKHRVKQLEILGFIRVGAGARINHILIQVFMHGAHPKFSCMTTHKFMIQEATKPSRGCEPERSFTLRLKTASSIRARLRRTTMEFEFFMKSLADLIFFAYRKPWLNGKSHHQQAQEAGAR